MAATERGNQRTAAIPVATGITAGMPLSELRRSCIPVEALNKDL